MAQGGTGSVLCRYFMHGTCFSGSSCSFSHDLNSKPNSVCRYYLQGTCSYGSRCRYDHVRPNGNAAVTESNNRSSASSSSAIGRRGPKPIIGDKRRDASPPSQLHPLGEANGATAAAAADLGGTTTRTSSKTWVDAEEFVPGQQWKSAAKPMTYAQMAKDGFEEYITAPSYNADDDQQAAAAANGEGSLVASDYGLCPYAAHSGSCSVGPECAYLHGDLCDYCSRAVLVPGNEQQRAAHTAECIREHERAMALSFAQQRSQDKACGVCMDVVWQKQPPCEQRFGILSNCNHVFCLQCIRKWRSNRAFDNETIRSCPECRVKSDFVTPSKYWFEDKEDKDRLIQDYKKVLSTKPCKYFDQGRGECPFNAHCFYRHAYPDGRLAEPRPAQRRRRRQNADGEEMDAEDRMNLWDFIEERENIAMLLQDLFDVEDMMEFDDTFFRYLSSDSESDVDIRYADLELDMRGSDSSSDDW